MSWVDTRQSRDESSFNTISQRGALWDHVFPFSRQTGLGWKEVTAKTATPPLQLHRASGFDLARARPLGLAAMRGEGRTGSAYETGGGQELAF
jgi:hypothetical protein